MAIPLENFAGYIRLRTTFNRGVLVDGKPKEETSMYIDPTVQMTSGPAGPVVVKPDDCAGILYTAPGGKLIVAYPE